MRLSRTTRVMQTLHCCAERRRRQALNACDLPRPQFHDLGDFQRTLKATFKRIGERLTYDGLVTDFAKSATLRIFGLSLLRLGGSIPIMKPERLVVSSVSNFDAPGPPLMKILWV